MRVEARDPVGQGFGFFVDDDIHSTIDKKYNNVLKSNHF